MCSGYARPGQTSVQLLNSFDLGMLLDLAYGEIVSGLTDEQRAEVDKRLDEVAAEYGEPQEEDELVEVTKQSTGEVIQITQGRLAQIRRNMGAGQTVRQPKPGTRV